MRLALALLLTSVMPLTASAPAMAQAAPANTQDAALLAFLDQAFDARVSLQPEAATFARAVFFSTRSQGPDPSVLVAPRLRITYQRSFAFESP